jgi:hypothetical protein
MKRIKTILLLSMMFSLAAAPAFAAVPHAIWMQGQKYTLCGAGAFARVKMPGSHYIVNNNNFMGRTECLSGSHISAAFRVSASGATATGPGSDAYPNIYIGCSWSRCSRYTPLPARLSGLRHPLTSWSTTENARGAWSAAYDLWFDPRPLRSGQAATEMMIWLNAQALYDPAGKGWPVVRLDGALWYVLSWETGNGRQQWRYVQFRKFTPRWSVTGLSLTPFFQYMESHGWVTPRWYLLNVEAGFEIWHGGTGLATTSFSASV